MNINVLKLMRFIENLDSKYFKEINISRSTLYEFKAKPKKLYSAKLSTIIKLQEYMNVFFEDINQVKDDVLNETVNLNIDKYVGVDVGIKNLLAASNHNFTNTFQSKTSKVNEFRKKYDKSMEHAMSSNFLTLKDTVKNKFIDQIEPIINEQVNLMIKNFRNDAIFIVGDNGGLKNPNQYSHQYIILKLVKDQLVRKLSGENRIIYYDETGSSIKCPRCHKSKKSNRTKANRFMCRKCGFTHDSNDVVASVNILNRYLGVRD